MLPWRYRRQCARQFADWRQTRVSSLQAMSKKAPRPNSFVSPGANAIVVRVERVLRAAPALQGQSGQLVTILNPAPGSTAPRQVFFVNPAFYGETIGVRRARPHERAR